MICRYKSLQNMINVNLFQGHACETGSFALRCFGGDDVSLFPKFPKKQKA